MKVFLPDVPVLQMWIETVHAIYHEELGRNADPSALAFAIHECLAGRATGATLRAGVRASPEYAQRQAAPTATTPWDTVTEAQLRRWTGAFCIPAALPDVLPYGGRIWTPAYGCYDDATRARILTAYTRRYPGGQFVYNASGLPYGGDYPELAPDPGRVQRDLEEIWQAGLIPHVFLADDRRVDDLGYLEPVVARCAHLLRSVSPTWEMNDPCRNDEGRINRMFQWVREALPGARCYAHFTPDHGSGGSNEPDWWHLMSGGHGHERWIHGFLLQTQAWTQSLPDLAAGIQSTLDRLVPRLGRQFSGWVGVDVDVVAYELTTTKTYRGWTEDQGKAVTDYVMTHTQGLSGFGDGGTV